MCLDELEEIEMTVGNLRVTKIGKLLMKFEKRLPEDLSARVHAIIERWKETTMEYRAEVTLGTKKQTVYY